MRRNWRALAGALSVVGLVGLALTVVPNVGAQKVLNPGLFDLNSTGGQIRIGTAIDVDLSPQPFPQCDDGIDNDGDNKIDLLDTRCVAGPNGEPASQDDSELASGFQPKVNVQISGTVDENGVVTVPKAGIVFPVGYVAIPDPNPSTPPWVVATEVLPAADATGSINPLTGDAVLNVKFRVKLSGVLFGNRLSANCGIGTDASPISLNLITGAKPATPGYQNAITGSRYNPTSGNAVLVDNAFGVPGATSCLANGVNISGQINSQMKLPSVVGKNAAVIAGRTAPVLAKGVNAKITTDPTILNGPAPLDVTFSAASSVVAKAPATYDWSFSDGTTASGLTVSKTFPNAGSQFAKLIVTDADGDVSEVTNSFVLTGGGTTTTTTTPTTTSTTSTTTPTTTSTTSTTTPTTTSTTTTSTTSTTSTTTPTTTSTTSTTTPTTTSTTTTSTTTPTTTSTTSTTTPTTTSTTSTTTSTTTPTTTSTTSTTIPQPSEDAVSVAVQGVLDYSNAGSGNGDLKVRRDVNGIVSVTGFLDIPGSDGGTARVTVNAQRAWILPLWTGQVSVSDPTAGVNISAPIFGSISRATTLTSAKGTSSWFRTGAFPNLIRPFSISWTVTDAG